MVYHKQNNLTTQTLIFFIFYQLQIAQLQIHGNSFLYRLIFFFMNARFYRKVQHKKNDQKDRIMNNICFVNQFNHDISNCICIMLHSASAASGKQGLASN